MSFETLKLLKQSWKFIVPYWKSEEKYKALALLTGILLLTIANIGLSVKLTYWSKNFYDALEKQNYQQFLYQTKIFFILILIFVPTFVSAFTLKGILRFRWRQWMTNQFLRDWTINDTYYHVMLDKGKLDNPDQRISEDLSTFPSLSLNLFLSFFEQILTLFSFAFVLWTISSGIPLKIFGHTFKIHGYLVWAAFLYAMFGTFIVVKIGKPLIDLNFKQQHYEANFRYSLIRLQDKREEIAIFGGIKPEVKTLKDSFSFIKSNYYSIIIRSIYINFSYTYFINLSQIIPLIAAAPMYFTGIITLGVVMQVQRAFEEVRSSFSVIASNFSTIAEWRASGNRLLELVDHIHSAKQAIKHNKISITESKENIIIHNLNLDKPTNEPMLRDVNLEIKAHDRILLIGSSGIGKSTIVRALHGLWTHGSGDIRLPNNIFYVPQRPYMPIGTLKEAIIYPSISSDYKEDNNEIIELLILFKLGHLVNHLNELNDWSTILSLGEQQRISFIRILINKPKLIVMDEPSSSLNPDLENLAFETILAKLKDTTILTIGHSETLKKFHKKIVNVEEWIAPVEV